jgi:hypothetical protein
MRTVVVEQPACAAAKITKRAIGPDRNRPKAQSWPADPAGGGLGIEEFIGFPDVVLVPDPATFRVLAG